MKNILIITYYWPPAGGASIYRWLNFAKALSQKGYHPIIVTTDKGDYPIVDNSIKVPKEIEVHRTFTPTFYNITSKLLKKNEKIPYGSFEITKEDSFLKKILLWIRVNLIAPDLRIFWNYFAYKEAEQIIRTKKIDVIITTGAPNSTHLIGYKLKKRYKLRWITDFRDGWTKSAYIEVVKRNIFLKQIDAKLEKNVLDSCDAIIACTKKLKNDLYRNNKTFLIYNNFNPDLYKDIKPHKFSEFSINHFGTITQNTDFAPLISLANLLKQKNINLKFRFWGRIEKRTIEMIEENKEISNYFEFYPPLPHSDMLKYLMGSSILLLYMNYIRINTVTLKIFEYIGAKIPILGIGPLESEPTKILQETNSGKMFEYNDLENILKFIIDIKNGKNIYTGENAYLYSLPFMTEKLIKIIENY